MSFTERMWSLLDSRLPLTIESDGRQDDWDAVGPAILVASGYHLRALSTCNKPSHLG